MTSTDLAPAPQRLVAKQPKPDKQPRISLRIKKAIEALVTGECKTQKDAAALAGLNAEHLCRELKKPQIEAYYTQRGAQILRSARMRAVARAVQSIDAQSEQVAWKAAERHLEEAGLFKRKEGGVSVSVNTTISAGYVIDLAPQDQQHSPLKGVPTIENTGE